MNDETMMEEGAGTLDALKTQIEQRRVREELKGVEYLGIRWHCDNAGRQAVTEAMQFADIHEAQHGEGTFTTQWKGMNGQWADSVTKADLLAVGMLMGQRRSACFARERELLGLADADPEGFDTTLIGSGWPA